MIAAIILAAGKSERMGTPKALLALRGSTFLEAGVVACEAAGLNRRVIVLSPDIDKLPDNIDLHGSTVVRNRQPASGPIGSIRLGIEAVVNHPVEAVLVWHVDRPHVSLTTLAAVIDRFRDGGVSIVVPEFRGQRGHPVLFGRAVFEELRQAPDDQGARSVVRADPSRVAFVAVDDPAILEDINTPEDYKALLGRIEEGGATLRRPDPES
ncbi:MAG: nucleotidyltransferase family protein [Gemmatimonadota bacterium]|nr:nucleotidyltransferase family protein [Gemmatimonadota bacterium]